MFPPCRPRRELPHDDRRRTHFDNRDTHLDDRRSDDDGFMMLVSRVPVPSALRNQTAGRGEEGDDAGK